MDLASIKKFFASLTLQKLVPVILIVVIGLLLVKLLLKLFDRVLERSRLERTMFSFLRAVMRALLYYSVEGRRRVDLYIGVSYDAPAEKVREALLAAAQHPKALQDPAPLVVLNNYQDSSIQYLLMLWTASGDYLDVRFAVNEAVKRELDARGIAIPYPQLDVHFEPQKRNT